MLRFFTVVVCSAALALAQSTSGTLVGTVTDSSGAVVPGAKVTAINEGTGIRTETSSNQNGDYVVPNLPAGNYTIRVEFEGFRTFQAKNIELLLNRTVRTDIRLEPGGMEQSITVTAEAPVVNSDSSSIYTIVDESIVSAVPVNGRTLDQLVLMAAGNTSDSPSTPRLAGSQYWGGTVYTMDGTGYNDVGNGGAAYSYSTALTTMPSIDSVKEMKIEANSAKAEHSGTSAISVISKSGTNRIKGSIYEFNRNRALTAKNFFATSQPKPNFNRNEFGFTIGGPIIKNRTFYFGSYEGLRQRTSTSRLLALPPVAYRRGDYSARSAALIDPLSGLPFPNKQIPESRLDPRSQKILTFVPAPNYGTTGNNYLNTIGNVFDVNRYTLKIDHQLNTRHSLAFSGNYSKGDPYFVTRGTPATYGNWENGGYITKNAAITHKATIGAKNVNEFRYSYFVHNSIRLGQNKDFDPSTIFPGLYKPLPVGGLPNISMTGYAAIGDYGGGWYAPQLTHQFTDNFTFIRGAHTFKTGGDVAFVRVSTPPTSGSTSLGSFTFNHRYTTDSFADFLLGYPVNSVRATPTQVNLLYRTQYGLYFQDDWKVNRKLTFNIGVRYTLQTTMNERDGSYSNFDFGSGRFVVRTKDGKLPRLAIERLLRTYPYVTSESIGWGSSVMLTDWNNVGPRFGFAYMPFGNAKTVIRGAYGISHNFIPVYIGIRQLSLNNNPFFLTETWEAAVGNTPTLSFADPFPGGAGTLSPNPAITAVNRNLSNAYAQQWNFTIERQIVRNLGLRMTYLGNKGTRVPWYNYNRNLPLKQAAATIQSQRPFQPWADITALDTNANSITHQMQTEVIRRFANGFSLQANYTWNRSIDNAKTVGGPQDPYAAFLDRGNSDGIRRHVVNIAGTYRLPFGAGRKLLNYRGVVDAIVGGWNLSTLTHLRSGTPFSVTMVPNLTGWRTERADVVPGVAVYPEEQTIQKWINIEAFARPQAYTFGNSPRNGYFGPPQFKIDVSLAKDFKFLERYTLQFRADAFNLPNHPSFSAPGAAVSTPSTFGRITSTSIENRAIQFAAKILF